MNFCKKLVTYTEAFKGILSCIFCPRLCGFEPFYDERGDQFMFRRILNCEYYFISPWWDEVSLNAKDLVSVTETKGNKMPYIHFFN